MSDPCPARRMRSHSSSMKAHMSRSNVDLQTAGEPLTVTPVSDTTALSPDHTTVKQEHELEPDMKQEEGGVSPSLSPTLVDDTTQNFNKSASPTPPPTTATSKSSTPPAVAAPRASKKGDPLPIQLIGDLPIAREEALSTFNEILDNNYQFKSLGRSREMLESMTCECTYEHGVDDEDSACGSDCINRLTQVECLEDDCRCRSYCQNQRFQRKEYANIEIVLTEKKGYGLRAEENLPKDSFIYEYVGDVVNPTSFKKRMRDYAEEGIRHFYFMMLQKDEFIDATKSGGIGRFANHSCSPNCYVAKWTIGNHVRMGIFAKRNIRAHEELTFNYNVDRYGHQAQECFCGEPNCVGYIGGKTQTDIATMDDLYLDALGITDEDDVRELKGTKKKKGKKIDDADFMPTMKPITETEVPKVVQAIRQTTSRKVLMKLLTRIKITEDASALRQIMRLRGYSLMTNLLEDYESDLEMITMSLECMKMWPLLNRNKVQDSKVFVPVEKFAALDNEVIKPLAQSLLDHWETLPVYSRIPKRALPIAEIKEPIVVQPVKQNDWDKFAASRKRRAIAVDERPRPKPVYVQPEEKVFDAKEWLKTDDGKQWDAERKKREADRKEKEEALKAIIASATAAAAAEDAAAATAAAEAKAKAEAAAAKEARRKERASKPKETAEDKEARKEKKLTKLIGPVVVKCMSKHSKSFDRDDFKKHAKELTMIITEKEKKSSSYRDNKLDSLSEEKVTKIKKFAKEYIAKVIRKMEKSGQNPPKASSSGSASMVRDTPTSSTAQQTPNSNDGNEQYTSFMSAEDAMRINFDSDVESDNDEDVAMADAPPYRAAPPPHIDPRTHKLGHDAMLVDDDPPRFISEDPRRRPLMDR